MRVNVTLQIHKHILGVFSDSVTFSSSNIILFFILITNRFQTTRNRSLKKTLLITFVCLITRRLSKEFFPSGCRYILTVFLQISFYSPPFYSSRHGYMMCCRLYPLGDGSGSGTHVSFFFAIMQGEHDSLLRWPFQQRVTLTLLDQSPARRHVSETFLPNTQSSSFQRPTSILNVASGCPRFVSHDQLTSTACKYINAGIVFLRVKVDLSGLQLLWIWNFFTSINSFILTKFRPQKNSFFFALVFFLN